MSEGFAHDLVSVDMASWRNDVSVCVCMHTVVANYIHHDSHILYPFKSKSANLASPTLCLGQLSPFA